jgi:Xaa-Pro aminopeptidase
MVKDPSEVAAIQRTGEVWVKTMAAISQSFQPNVDEYDLALRVEAASRAAGHQGLVRTHALDFEIFLGHLLSGPHGAVPTRFDGPTGGPGVHPATAQGAGHRPVGPGDPVLADYACAKDGYVYDGTRTFVWGALSRSLRAAYDVCRQVHQMLDTHLRAGGTVAQVTQAAFGLAEEAGLSEHFMGYGPDRVKFLGHGVGLELDELPVLLASSSQVLVAGMVIAVEPKFVFPGQGAVGLENTYLVREGPPLALADYPDGVIALGQD